MVPIERAEQPNKPAKGTMLELRIARLLLAQGITPFTNVYFRTEQEASGISRPDVDVLGCVVVPDGTMFHIHVDCKSGDSNVVNRLLLLKGLSKKMPPGPILYIRPKTRVDLKRYGIQEGIRIADIAEIEKREQKIATPLFGALYPAFTDPDLYQTWGKIMYKAKGHALQNIVRYLETGFWAEGDFTRIKRCIAASQLCLREAVAAGLDPDEVSLLIAQILRRLVYACLTTTSRVAYFSEKELQETVAELLITESLPVADFQRIVSSTAELIFETHGDPNKGPLRAEDYLVPPPDYVEELCELLLRTTRATEALRALLPMFDGLLIEAGMRKRDTLAKAILSRFGDKELEEAMAWYRGFRLFVLARNHELEDWKGWKPICEKF